MNSGSPYHKLFLINFIISIPLFVSSKPVTESSGELKPMIVTAKGGFPKPLWTTAGSANFLPVSGISRSMPEALFGLPSVMIQKTALGQTSPYIRGLTGYHNLLLVDGIRLNHSAMRSGPNQYWSTVEILGADRIELVRGPYGSLHGADAIGGVVNILHRDSFFKTEGKATSGRLFNRLSSAERSWGAGFTGTVSSPAWFTEISHTERSFGDLDGGKKVGKQPFTGYDTRGTNVRISRRIAEHAKLTFGIQSVRMKDVPRTHKTIHGLSWRGLTPGKEMWRRLGQSRDLYYTKLSWKDSGGLADDGQIILSLHQHGQERKRMKGSSSLPTGGDFQTFELDDFGFSARFQTDSPWEGRLSYGIQLHKESLSSGGFKFDANEIKTIDLVQGPLAAEAEYDRSALYVENDYEFDNGWTIQPGIRFSSVRAGLEKYYSDNDDIASLLSPETKSYEELIGSLRASKQVGENQLVFLGLSQGFRPPSLYDLTSTDETSAVEEPNTILDPERFLQAEIGWRGRLDSWEWSTSYYHTWMQDMIVRSPVESGKAQVLKANGDGYIQGVEIELAYDWSESWRSEISFSWMDGAVEQLLDNNSHGSVIIDGRTYTPVDRATTRLMPTQTSLLTRYEPPSSPWANELKIMLVGDAEDLSLKDKADTSRIPQNGTPGYIWWGLSSSYELSVHSNISLAVENIGDIDYRVHGSGINGPGRNFILSYLHTF